MSDIDLKAALHEQARITRKAGEALKINAEAMLASAQALVLIAGAIEEQTGSATPEPPSTAREPFAATPAPAAPKATRQRKAADPAPTAPAPVATPATPAPTMQEAQVVIRELVAVKGGDQAKAVLARNGVQRVSEAKPEHYAKIISDAKEALAGKDFNASSDASPFD